MGIKRLQKSVGLFIFVLALMYASEIQAQGKLTPPMRAYFDNYTAALNNLGDSESSMEDRQLFQEDILEQYYDRDETIVYNYLSPKGSRYLKGDEFLSNLRIDFISTVSHTLTQLSIIEYGTTEGVFRLQYTIESGSKKRVVDLQCRLDIVALTSSRFIATIKNIELLTKPTEVAEKDTSKKENGKNLPAVIQELENNMVYVAGGSFQMGCTSEQGDCWFDVKPVHRVSIDAYRIGRYEVTNEEYAVFLNEKGNQEEGGSAWVYLAGGFEDVVCGIEEYQTGRYRAKRGLEKHPMIYVTWYGARAYCKWLSQKTGKNYRLPSEAEWEYAARGGNQSRSTKYSGSNNLASVAWYDDNSGAKTHRVGGKSVNELGLYDMSGNVREWCSDCWHNDYRGAPTDGSAWLEVNGCYSDRHVSRGGYWGSSDVNCRSSDRDFGTTNLRSDDSGFRVVQD